MSGKATVLTETKISKLKFKQNGPTLQRYWDASQPGLFVTVYPAPRTHRQTGRKTYSMRISLENHKQRIKKIGNVGEITLSQARDLAARLRGRRVLPLTLGEAFRAILKNTARLRLGRNCERTVGAFESKGGAM